MGSELIGFSQLRGIVLWTACGCGFQTAVYGCDCGLQLRVRSRIVVSNYQKIVIELMGTAETPFAIAVERSSNTAA